MRPALPFHPPLGGPGEIGIVPFELPDQGDFPAEFGGAGGQSRERHRRKPSSIEARLRQRRLIGQHDGQPAPGACREQRLTRRDRGLPGIRRDHVVSCAQLHPDKDRKARPVRKPRFKAERREEIVDLPFIEVDDQVVGPVAGALLVANGRAGHLVVIAVHFDEICRARLVFGQPRIAGQLHRAGHLDEHILQAGGEADGTVGLALAGDDGLRPIEIIRRGRRGRGAKHQRSQNRHPDHAGNHSLDRHKLYPGLERALLNSVHVRFTPKATLWLHGSGISRSAGPGYSNT
ncbi:hypothetical protein GALL_519120 [mine drainage metagenome]|uniref:Uncharacterized protein n=1 Tax=mine drainage metagenome TaxID=410659 RepID=A0A1J5PMI8_9ZZZZ